MPIKTEVEQAEKGAVVLTVEVPFDELGALIDKAYRDVTRTIKISGFRKGKVPRPIIDQMVGKDAVLQEAANDMVSAFYPEAVQSSGISPVTMPKVQVVQLSDGEPLIFKATVDVRPEVKLGDYSELIVDDIEQEPVPKEVEKQIDRLRDKFATLEVVEGRAAKKDDFVLIDYEGYIEDKPFEGGRGSDYMLQLGSETFIPGFEDQLIGSEVDSDAEVKVSFPEDYQMAELAGAEAVFKVKVKEIKTKKQPNADDEFAKSVSKFDNMKEWKTDLEKIVIEGQKKAKEAGIRSAAIEKMVDISEVEPPEGMISDRVDEMIEDFSSRIREAQGISIEEWSKEAGIEVGFLRDNYSKEALRNIKAELIVGAVIDAEGLEASDEDIENEIKRLAEGTKRDINDLKKEINNEDSLSYLRKKLTVNKAVDFLAAKAVIKKRDDVNESSTDSD
jgi:trigger factor